MNKIDRDLINALAGDARLSYRELAERVALSPNAIAERVRRLVAEGAIRGFHADVNPAAVGRPLEVYIDVKLRPETSAASFEAAIRTIQGIRSATLVTGAFDYLVRVACADPADMVRLTEELRERTGIQETYSRVICREVNLAPL